MLPPDIVKELRYIEVYTAKKIRNMRIGGYTSRLRGSGFDFDEHRLYRTGDDVRRIDWNTTARIGVPFVRETHAERELNVMIALDLSSSMAFGTAGGTKKRTMLFVAACLVFSAINDGINTGFLTFSDRVLSYRPPRRTRAAAWSVLEELWNLDPPEAPTLVLPAARYLASHLRKMSVIFLISDFMTAEDLGGSRDLKMLAGHHDLVGVVVEDPAESRLPVGTGAVGFRDLETGARLRVGLSGALRRDYLAYAEQRRQDLIESFYQVPMDHAFLRSDQPALEPLLRLFLARRRK